ncbi:uncharacterized protein LOC144202780 isoform X1 [Stigmatopora nigra]
MDTGAALSVVVALMMLAGVGQGVFVGGERTTPAGSLDGVEKHLLEMNDGADNRLLTTLIRALLLGSRKEARNSVLQEPQRFGRSSRGPLVLEEHLNSPQWEEAPNQIWSMAVPQRRERQRASENVFVTPTLPAAELAARQCVRWGRGQAGRRANGSQGEAPPQPGVPLSPQHHHPQRRRSAAARQAGSQGSRLAGRCWQRPQTVESFVFFLSVFKDSCQSSAHTLPPWKRAVPGKSSLLSLYWTPTWTRRPLNRFEDVDQHLQP